MRREEIRAAIERDPEVVVDLVLSLMAAVEQLTSEIAEIKLRLTQGSRNGSRPPSSDPPQAPKRSGSKPGGQPGHEGRSRGMVADPD